MRVAEIYQSLQGEGFLTGTPSVFVRTSGCNLRCQYCDTPFASWNPQGDDMSVDEIIAAIDQYACRHVVLTGGEPMLFSELVPLCAKLQRASKHITIETAGTLSLPVECDLMSISPKLSNSTPTETSERWVQRHENSRYAPEVIRFLLSRYNYQLKFVVGSEADADEVLEYLSDFPQINRDRVMLMPEGVTLSRLHAIGSWLEPLCANHCLTYCPRRHIEWYGAMRGT